MPIVHVEAGIERHVVLTMSRCDAPVLWLRLAMVVILWWNITRPFVRRKIVPIGVSPYLTLGARVILAWIGMPGVWRARVEASRDVWVVLRFQRLGISLRRRGHRQWDFGGGWRGIFVVCTG